MCKQEKDKNNQEKGESFEETYLMQEKKEILPKKLQLILYKL